MENFMITNNEKNLRFETPVGQDLAFVEYRWHYGDIAFMHTYVPDAGRGTGVASALAKHVLEYARERKLKILVYCPYIAQYIKRHPEYETLITTLHG
jgi:predicted GNAT family acetyltransferase